MIHRPFWVQKINVAWQKRPLVWLSGVRRVGKTTLTKMLGEHIYLNCDLPSVKRRLEDPESYFAGINSGSTIVIDEVHRLNDPSQVLKIAADEYQELKILATGSSTIEATSKFKDSLTGRKTSIYLSPVLWDECRNLFGLYGLDQRLLNGGLPEMLMATSKDTSFYAEWMDSFYARDVQELFNIRNRQGFMKLMQLILMNSGSLIEHTQLSKHTGLTRPTVYSYLDSLSIANFLYLLPPFHGGGKREITQRPKCYAFDTGFVTFAKGWNEIRDEDRGILWEHLVLDMLRTTILPSNIFYWRNKSGLEIDFVVKQENNQVDVFECKINPAHFSIKHFIYFREIYKLGRNFCICPNIKEAYRIHINGYNIDFISDLKSIY